MGPDMGGDMGPDMGPDMGGDMGPDMGPDMGADMAGAAKVTPRKKTDRWRWSLRTNVSGLSRRLSTRGVNAHSVKAAVVAANTSR